MAYELRALRRQKVRYNSANTDNPLWFTLVDDSSKTAMASGDAATITIYAPGNATALVEDGDMTETIGSSVITYSPDTTTTASWPVGEGYRADVTVAISGGLTFTRHFIFDVVKYPLVLPMTRDQLVDRSDLIDGMNWAGDGDFIGILEACRDELQLKLEGLAYLHGRILEDMALDASKLAVVWRPYVLEAIYREKGMTEKADYYLTRANELWDLYSAQVRFDTGQDGEEDSSPTRLVKTRFYT
jgi:hypothetical protein